MGRMGRGKKEKWREQKVSNRCGEGTCVNASILRSERDERRHEGG